MSLGSSAKLELLLAAKDIGASKGVDKLHAAFGRLHSTVGRVGGGLRSAASGLATVGKIAGVAALGGFAALTSQILLGSKALAEQSKIDAQTAAVIKSTGGAAHVTAKHIDDLANSIKEYSGVDDDAIKKGENMLLTFTEIRNGVGKNKQVFDEATQTLVDMSVAMGTDTAKQAIQLGKALNDPVKGISALSKVGVTFTDKQKKLIATLVKSGDVMGAQKVILAELHREFGGSAKAVGDSADGAWNKFQNAVGDLQKQLASYLMPTLVSVLQFVTGTVIPAIGRVADGVASWMAANAPLISQIKGFVGGALSALFGIIGNIAGAIGSKGKGHRGKSGASLLDTLIGMAKTVIDYVVPKVQALFHTLGDVAASVGKVVGPILKALLPAFGKVVVALFGGGGGGGGRNGRGGGKKSGGLVGALGDLIGVLWGNGDGALGMVVKFAGAAFKVLLDALADVIGKIASLIGWVKDAIGWLGKLADAATHVNAGPATRGGYHGFGPNNGNAGGGLMFPGRTYDIAERRGERVTMGLNGTAYVQSSIPQQVGRGGGGGDTLVIQTTFPPTDSQMKQIVDAFDRYRYRNRATSGSGNRF